MILFTANLGYGQWFGKGQREQEVDLLENTGKLGKAVHACVPSYLRG